MSKIVEFIESFVVIGLVLAGIGGLSYHTFREDGWFEALAGNVFDIHTQYPLIAIPLTIAAIYLFITRRRRKALHSSTSKVPNVILYAIMATGVYFIGRVVITGGF